MGTDRTREPVQSSEELVGSKPAADALHSDQLWKWVAFKCEEYLTTG